jgi:hypothetical protein
MYRCTCRRGRQTEKEPIVESRATKKIKAGSSPIGSGVGPIARSTALGCRSDSSASASSLHSRLFYSCKCCSLSRIVGLSLIFCFHCRSLLRGLELCLKEICKECILFLIGEMLTASLSNFLESKIQH